MAKKNTEAGEFKPKSVNIKILSSEEMRLYLALQAKAKMKGTTLHDKFFDMCRKEAAKAALLVGIFTF